MLFKTSLTSTLTLQLHQSYDSSRFESVGNPPRPLCTRKDFFIRQGRLEKKMLPFLFFFFLLVPQLSQSTADLGYAPPGDVVGTHENANAHLGSSSFAECPLTCSCTLTTVDCAGRYISKTTANHVVESSL